MTLRRIVRNFKGKLCLDCGGSELFTTRRCQPCNEAQKIYMRLYRAARRKAGMCLYCVCTPAPGRTMCEVHLLRHALSQVKTRARRMALREAA